MRGSVQALLELGHPGLQPPVRFDQFIDPLTDPHEQGNSRLPVAVENRLCLGSVHGG